MAFTSSRDYHRFRNTVLGASRDLQVISSLVENYPMLDSGKVWGVRLGSGSNPWPGYASKTWSLSADVAQL